MVRKLKEAIESLNTFSKNVLLFGGVFSTVILGFSYIYYFKALKAFDLDLYRMCMYCVDTAIMLFFIFVVGGIFFDLLYKRLEQ